MSVANKLRIRNGPYSGREKTLVGEAVTIGRDVEASIQILDRSASRFHCEVFPVGGMWFVRDLESKNGTYVNSEPLEDEELLREGDVIRIGSVELVYETGVAVGDQDSDDRLKWSDDMSLLSNTLEFRVDDLSDIEDQGEGDLRASDDARTLQMLYHIGKMVANGMDSTLPLRVCNYLVSTMPAQCVIIFMRDRRSGKLTPHTLAADDTRTNPVVTRTLIRRVMMENRAILTANAQEDERLNRKDSAVLKGIGSVICVPLSIAGQTRGVLYMARSPGSDAFSQRDLEMVSAAAVQLGLAFQSLDHLRHQRQVLWRAILAMVKIQELRADCLGSGERCARAAVAIGQALQLSSDSLDRLRFAGLLHHIGVIGGPPATQQNLLAHLDAIEDFCLFTPLIHRTHEYRQGQTGPTSEGDVEERVILVASAFEDGLRASPEADAVQLIDRLGKDPRLDGDVLGQLRACHLDGRLYAPESS
ncbi:MAG: FHA domain-containing protein [Planctomycetota bacterium]|nr:MAG: FHA domain-containing protein [Planctomycetota bacterium]